LKGNQETAYSEVRGYFAGEALQKGIMEKDGGYFRETEITPCQIITREYFITNDINWFEDRKEWEKLTSIGYGEKTIFNKEAPEGTIEERHYLCTIIGA